MYQFKNPKQVTPTARLPSVRDRNFLVSLPVLSVFSFTRKPIAEAREIEESFYRVWCKKSGATGR